MTFSDDLTIRNLRISDIDGTTAGLKLNGFVANDLFKLGIKKKESGIILGKKTVSNIFIGENLHVTGKDNNYDLHKPNAVCALVA